MAHPNEDFIKKFLGKSNKDPKQVESDLRKKRLNEYYESLDKPKVQNLSDEQKKELTDTAKKIFAQNKKIISEKKSDPREDMRKERAETLMKRDSEIRKKKLEEYYTEKPVVLQPEVNLNAVDKILSKQKPQLIAEQTQKSDWLLKNTPFGVFYYNAKTDSWMNTFGTIKKTLDQFFAIEDLSISDSGPATTLVNVTESFFSDSGNYLALYTSETEEVTLYSISYSPSVTLTEYDVVNVGNVPIKADSQRKVFVSDDAKYLLISCPNYKSVYFFDVNANSLLQTITEDYTAFGNNIAVDKDFLGMAISTPYLTRGSNQYDGRSTSYAISSPICYYKRNFGSSGAQSFKKIHMQNAYALTRNNGYASINGIADKLDIPNGDLYMSYRSGSAMMTTGINRCGDIKVKGYNFALANYGQESDQIAYRAHFPNYSNSKYDIVKKVNGAGFTFEPCYSTPLAFKLLNATGGMTLGGGQKYPAQIFSDDFMADTTNSNYFMEGHFSLKNFSIVRKIGSNYIYDSSYSDPGSIPVITIPEIYGLKTAESNINSVFQDTFMEKTEMYYNFVPGGIPPTLANRRVDDDARNNLRREYCQSVKVAVNSTDTYSVSKYITNSNVSGVGVTMSTQNLNIANIRFHRFPCTNTEGNESYFYNDWKYQGGTFVAEPVPINTGSGMVKVLLESTNETALEQSFNSTSGGFALPGSPASPTAQSPILEDPTNCPNSEFKSFVSSSLITQELSSVYASDNRLFVNLTNNTLIYIIDTTKTYKPLLYETTLNENLNTYNFCFNASGEFLSKNNKMYKYNRTTKQLDLVSTIVI